MSKMPQRALGGTSNVFSTSPFWGVLAVLLGGSLSTLNGRLLSVALPDVRGALHLSVDEAAWISAAYNMALMFIAVFSVYLGGVLGARRVLLASCAVYGFASFLIPFAPNFNALIALQVIAGIASGTFYPLTLSFILLSLPIRIAQWGLAGYSLAILFSVNIASAAAAWYLNVLSWRWTFWCFAAFAPVMAVFVYYGIPRQPLPKGGQASPNWRGLLYWSLGLATIFGALDQGERLHWFTSPTYAAMLAAGIFLLLVSFVRRKLDPNPLIDVPFLRDRNTFLLAIILFSFRLFILASALLIPQFLAGVAGLRNEQIGQLLSIVALLQFGTAWLVAHSLRTVNSRIILAAGFLVIGLTAFLCSHITSVWTPRHFIPFAILFGVGESLAMLGLVSSIVLQVISSGAVSGPGKVAKPFSVLTFSSFFHTVRIMGGEIATVLMIHLLSERTKFHANVLAQGVNLNRPFVQKLLSKAMAVSGHLGRSPNPKFIGYALGLTLRQQASVMAYADGFTVMAWACIAVLVLIASVRLRMTTLEELQQ